jgi:pimeloyl-ACP methyl ester carboxylesterase
MLDALLTVLTYIGCVLVTLILIIMVLAYRYRHLQDLLVYHPEEPDGSRTRMDGPREHRVARYEMLEVPTPDGVTLRGFLVQPTHGTPRCAIIYFHGNAGNAGHRTPIARLLADRTNSTVVMMDYRGYGLSDPAPLQAHPNEAGIKIDAEATMDYCLGREDISRLPIFVMGTSLGGAVTVYLASLARYERYVAGWIVENTFTSIGDMADVVFAPPIKRMYPGWRSTLLLFTLSRVIKPIVLQIGWYSIDLIRSVTGPMLFISSAKDELVPPSHMRALHDSARAVGYKRFLNLPDSGHNDAPAASGYAESIGTFLNDVLSRRGGQRLGAV